MKRYWLKIIDKKTFGDQPFIRMFDSDNPTIEGVLDKAAQETPWDELLDYGEGEYPGNDCKDLKKLVKSMRKALEEVILGDHLWDYQSFPDEPGSAETRALVEHISGLLAYAKEVEGI